LHHGLEGAPGDLAALGHGVSQHARRDLPRQAPLVLAPAAGAFRSAVVDDGVPVAVRFLLVVGGDLERERFALFEGGAAVEAQAWNAADGEFNRQDRIGLAAGEVGRRAMDGADRAVRKTLA